MPEFENIRFTPLELYEEEKNICDLLKLTPQKLGRYLYDGLLTGQINKGKKSNEIDIFSFMSLIEHFKNISIAQYRLHKKLENYTIGGGYPL